MGRKPKPETLAKAVADFNARHPIGSTAIYTEVIDNPATEKAVTIRSGAWVLGDGRTVVAMIAGKAGAVSIKHIKPTGT